MINKSQSKKIYKFAYCYLIQHLPEGVSEVELKRYLSVDKKKIKDLKDVFLIFIHSAQNYQRMPNTIKFDERREEFKEILAGFDLKKSQRWMRTNCIIHSRTSMMLRTVTVKRIVAENSWYFRNALVRANYNNIKNGVYETTEFVEKFLRGLLMEEKHEYHNREMHISGIFLLGHAEPINDPINDPIKLDAREKEVLDLIRKEPELTRKALAERLGCSDSTVKRALASMVDKGAIKRIGANKKGAWIILEG